MNRKIILACFAVATLICLAGRLSAAPLNGQLDYISKPLLMPLLYLYYRASTHANVSFKDSIVEYFTMGLFFAWWGDLFLMIGSNDFFLFISGLVGFLVMQLLYIRLYSKYSSKKSILFKSKPYLAIPSLVIALGFYFLLFPNLKPVLKIAIGFYALALAGMTLGAINRLGKCTPRSFWLVTIGAFSFMFSDMMIGMNKFLFTNGFPLAGFWIMITYIGGQLLIIEGIVIEHRHRETKIKQ